MRKGNAATVELWEADSVINIKLLDLLLLTFQILKCISSTQKMRMQIYIGLKQNLWEKSTFLLRHKLLKKRWTHSESR